MTILNQGLAIAFALVFAFGALAQDNEPAPTDFAADKVTYYEAGDRITLDKNAMIEGKDIIVNADRIEIYLLIDEEGERSIDYVEAFGGVIAVIEGVKTTSETAVYNAIDRTAVFVGDVVSVRDDSVIRGERLEGDIETGIYHVIGGVNGRISGALNG